jgi:Methyltransferase domain
LSRALRFGGLFRERPLHERRIAILAYRGLRAAAAKVGIDLVLRTFYSPVPHLDELEPGTFDRVSELPGVRWDLDSQVRFVDERLVQLMAEFRPPLSVPEGSHIYAIDNRSYSLLDAAVGYGMVRWLRPRLIVELGSGHSTLVMAQAGLRNQTEGSPSRLDVFDPFPSVVSEDLPGLHSLHRTPAQDVPLTVFDELGDGDILFVDTTHTVKIGSEVNFLVLEVLPRLQPGVVVHFHDIFLPFEYPRRWVEDFGLYWNEQYLIQAFLVHNESWEVLVATQALSRMRRRELTDLVSSAVVAHDAGSFWMHRKR